MYIINHWSNYVHFHNHNQTQKEENLVWVWITALWQNGELTSSSIINYYTEQYSKNHQYTQPEIEGLKKMNVLWQRISFHILTCLL